MIKLSEKILLVPQKYEIIMVLTNYIFFNIAIAKLDISQLRIVKLSLFIFFAIIS